MSEKRLSSVYYDSDEQLLNIVTKSSHEREQIGLNVFDGPLVGINKDSDTEDLLDNHQTETTFTILGLGSNIPARYVIAIWAFFGFFCLYALRVNLSVAIVAMVSIDCA